MDVTVRKNGFTLVEMLVSTVIIAIVIAATGQAVRLILSELRDTEKRQMAVEESLDLDFYIRRANKNISNSRINNLMTYVSIGSNITPRGANLPGRPVPSMVIQRADWLPAASANPLHGQVTAHFAATTSNVFIDSSTLEEHQIIQSGGSLDKITRRFVISRCDRWENFVDLQDHTTDPAITAYYLLHMVSRRPFIKVNQNNPLDGLNCCLPNEPNCSNARVNEYYFRSYIINFDNNQRVVNVEEFPKSTEGNAITGSGFAMYFPAVNSASTDVRTFTIKNRCMTNSRLIKEICSQKLTQKEFFEKAVDNQGIIELQLRTIGVRLSNDIVQTGIISL